MEPHPSLSRRDSLGRLLEPTAYVLETPSGTSPAGGQEDAAMDSLIDAFDAAWMGGRARGVSGLPRPDALRQMGAVSPMPGLGVHGSAVCVTTTGMAITHGHAGMSASPPHMNMLTAGMAPRASMDVPKSGGEGSARAAAPVGASAALNAMPRLPPRAGQPHPRMSDEETLVASLPMTPPPAHAPIAQRDSAPVVRHSAAVPAPHALGVRGAAAAAAADAPSNFASVFFSPIPTNFLNIPCSESNDSFMGGTSVGSPEATLRGGQLAMLSTSGGAADWDGNDAEDASPSAGAAAARSAGGTAKARQVGMPSIHEAPAAPEVRSHAVTHGSSANTSVSPNSGSTETSAGMHASGLAGVPGVATASHDPALSMQMMPPVNMLHALGDGALLPGLPSSSVGVVMPGHSGGISIAAVASANKKLASNLRLIAGTAMIPHVDKTDKGGEDAFCISLKGLGAIGVADGVSGWAEEGIDPAEYSRSLMRVAQGALDDAQVPHGADPREVIRHAHHETVMPGSSTICVCVMKPLGRMAVANLGDSGVRLIRDGRIIFASSAQQHMFNMPFQLSHPSIIESPDDADCAEVTMLDMQPGDVVVLATDGLYDNVFDDEIASITMDSLRTCATARLAAEGASGSDPAGTAPAPIDVATLSVEDAEHVAKAIAHTAHTYAQNPYRKTPWSVSAVETGMPWARFFAKGGGKMDDVTVVVGFVREVDKD